MYSDGQRTMDDGQSAGGNPGSGLLAPLRLFRREM